MVKKQLKCGEEYVLVVVATTKKDTPITQIPPSFSREDFHSLREIRTLV